MNTYGRLLFAISIGIMIAGFSSIFKGKGNEISYAIKADEVFGRDAIIIDIRSTEEYNIAHIKGAISVPYGGCNSCFVNNMESFKGKEIILYCNDGTKSKEAIKLLLENNFTNIKYIEGGINAWKEKGYYLTNENPEYAFTLGFKPLPADIKEEPLNNLNTPLTPPSEWDWRNVNGEDYTTPAKNQGNCGSCWDFAAMGALEAMINIVEGDANLDLDLSEQYILSCYSYGTGCNGGNAYYAYEYIYNNGGAIPETCFPYTGYDTTPCSNKCSDWQHKLVPISGYGYNSTADINAIKSLIVNHGPICLSFDVYSDFYDGSPSFDSNGVYKHQSGYYRGGHQVMCVGYKDTPGNQNYSGYWICKNSWGATWGPWDNGFFGIAYGECNIEGDVVWVSYSSTAPDTFVYGPSGIINYNNVTFNWTGTDGNTPTEYLVYSYILEGYDLNWSEWTSSTSKTYYNLPDGNYTFKVRAKDKAGIPDYTPATLNLTIATANIPPVSIPNGPYSGIAGQQILFNGSNSYDIDGYIVNYTWNFGDGSIGYGASCYHAYTNPGNYTVTLTVIDNEGANSTNSTYAIISAGGEIIDQSQQTYSGEVSIYGTIKYAQSFIPSLSKITKVELYIRKQGLPANLTFSIRESLTGANIVTVVKQASEISSSLSWITFDFNDINVTVGKTYYIVLETSGGSSSNCYKWGYGSNNPYANGSAWVYTRTWSQLNVDMCFREYGIGIVNSLPVANFTYEPLNPFIGQTIYFNSTSYDIDGSIINWTWNLGDGNIKYGEKIIHQYSSVGSYNVNLTVTDDFGAKNSIVKQINVSKLNNPPIANDDYYSTDEDVVLIINAPGILANDSDADGDSLTAELVSNPSHGSIVLNSNGSFVYTPQENYYGTDSFTYKAFDGIAYSNIATVYITINPINDAPIANFTYEPLNPIVGETIYFNSTSYDIDGSIINWTWNFGDGFISYEKNTTHIYSEEGVYIVTLLVRDNEGGIANSTKEINVTFLLNPHSAIYICGNNNFTYENGVVGGNGSENNPYLIENWKINSSANHGIWIENTDVYFIIRNCEIEGNNTKYGIYLNNVRNGRIENSISRFNYIGVLLNQSSSIKINNLTLSNNSDDGIFLNFSNYNEIEDCDIFENYHGIWIYSSSYNKIKNCNIYNNSDDGIFLSLSSSNEIKECRISSNTYGIRLWCLCNNNELTNLTIISNSYGIYQVDSFNTHIHYSIFSNNFVFGVYNYQGSAPNATYCYWGHASGPYHPTLNPDGQGDNVSDNVIFNPWLISPPTNTPPIANDDYYSTDEDVVLITNAPGILANDSDADGDSLTAELVSNPTHGSIVLNSNGSFVYTPQENYYGTDSFTYKAFDGIAYSNIATVYITITAVNDPPVAVDDYTSTSEDVQILINVTENDYDIDGSINLSSITITQNPSHGSLTVHSNGTVTYTPQANYHGSDSFKYKVKDNDGIYSNEAFVNITINSINDAPVSIPNGPYSGIAGQQILFNGSNSYDIDGYIVNYTWNFGDGSIGYGASCYHAYTNPGNYTVTLTVIDNEGANSTNSTYAIISAGGEIIDQSQQTYSGEVSIYGTIKYAQSFIPSLSKITKVELYIRKQGLPASLTFSIRESLTGANIVTVVKQASEIPSSLSWITFDFNDINVTVGKTYYIVLETSGGSSSNCYKWGYGSSNPYANGSAWVYTRTWSQLNVDMCFREYGLL